MNHIKLRNIRRKKRVPLKQISQALGVAMITYCKKERGESHFLLKNLIPMIKILNLSLDEFIKIFFDGVAPFELGSKQNRGLGKTYFPLIAARMEANIREIEAADALLISVGSLRMKESGASTVTLEQCKILSRLYRLSPLEFNDIFFNSQLPFSDEDLISYNNTAKAG